MFDDVGSPSHYWNCSFHLLPVKESARYGVWESFLPSHISSLGPRLSTSGMRPLSTTDQQSYDSILGGWFLGSIGTGGLVSLCISVCWAHLAPRPPPAPAATSCHPAAVRRCSHLTSMGSCSLWTSEMFPLSLSYILKCRWASKVNLEASHQVFSAPFFFFFWLKVTAAVINLWSQKDTAEKN